VEENTWEILIAVVEVEETVVADLTEILIVDQEKCTRQHALSVRKNAKFHSNQLKVSQFIAKNVILR
jgi:hypothetical protein